MSNCCKWPYIDKIISPSGHTGHRESFMRANECFKEGCHHCSEGATVPSIMPPRFESQANHLFFYQFELCHVEKTKRGRDWPFFKKHVLLISARFQLERARFFTVLCSRGCGIESLHRILDLFLKLFVRKDKKGTKKMPGMAIF